MYEEREREGGPHYSQDDLPPLPALPTPSPCPSYPLSLPFLPPLPALCPPGGHYLNILSSDWSLSPLGAEVANGFTSWLNAAW
jgi:hypothetical protein